MGLTILLPFVSGNLVASTSWSPLGPPRAVQRLFYFLPNVINLYLLRQGLLDGMAIVAI